MRIHFAMSCYNNIDYTKKFIGSVNRYSGSHEINWHIVDNGSTDGTYEHLKSIFPRYLVRHERNESVALAWNKALEASMSGGPELICLANNDVIVSENWIDPIERELNLHKGEKVYWTPNELRVSEEEFQKVAKNNSELNFRVTEKIEHMLCMVFFQPRDVRLFHPIPQELTLWFNDNWIDAKLSKEGYWLFCVKDSSVLHFVSKTVSITPDVSARIERDKRAWEEVRKRI